MFIFIFYFHFYHRACRYGNKKATHILLDKGATPSVRNAKGITPLHMACQFNHFDIVKVHTIFSYFFQTSFRSYMCFKLKFFNKAYVAYSEIDAMPLVTSVWSNRDLGTFPF